jgi:hypothetical protein
MATLNQIEANRLNATHSTGPRTDAGREAVSQNRLTLGLFTRRDYVKPEERELYKEFCDGFYAELCPQGHVESSLANDIVSASWRLRRCAEVDGDLADFAPQDPLLDEATEKTRRAVERARNSAHGHFHRSLNQLRKIQTERAIRLARYGEDFPGLAESNKMEAAASKRPPAPEPLDSNEKLALNCQEPTVDVDDEVAEAAEAAEEAEFARKFFSLDEAGQLQLLAERRKQQEAELEAILDAA